MQRRIAELVFRIELRVRLDQDSDDREIAVHRRIVQRRCAFLVGLVRVPVTGDQRPDLSGVVLARRPRDIVPITAERRSARAPADRLRRLPTRRAKTRSGESHDTSLPRAPRSAGEPVERRLDVSTDRPGSGGGRRTMMTGRPSSRAAISFASVAAPPLALQTSTSMRGAPSVALLGEGERAAPEDHIVRAKGRGLARRVDEADQKMHAGHGAKRRARRRRSSAKRGVRSGRRSQPPQPHSTSIQRSSGWRGQGGRNSSSRGTFGLVAGDARASEIRARKDGSRRSADRSVLREIGGEPPCRQTRRCGPAPEAAPGSVRPASEVVTSSASPNRADVARASSAASAVPPRINSRSPSSRRPAPEAACAIDEAIRPLSSRTASQA